MRSKAMTVCPGGHVKRKAMKGRRRGGNDEIPLGRAVLPEGSNGCALPSCPMLSR